MLSITICEHVCVRACVCVGGWVGGGREEGGLKEVNDRDGEGKERGRVAGREGR